MTRGLTHKQEMILRFILHYTRENGYPPTIREIGNQFGISSLRGVTVHLDALQRKGYIERGNTPRSIRIIHPKYLQTQQATMLPLVGTIAAGTAADRRERKADGDGEDQPRTSAGVPICAPRPRNSSTKPGKLVAIGRPSSMVIGLCAASERTARLIATR